MSTVKILHYMKRYILITLFCFTLVPLISAQSLAQVPYAQMQSTSVMAGSGSQYASNVPAIETTNQSAPQAGAIRRSPGDHHDEVHDDPVGDAALPLMIMALIYGAIMLARKRRV